MAVLSLPQALTLLQKEYQEGRLIPFLGAGFSMPLNLPSWSELVGWMAEKLRFEPELFTLHGRNEQLAEYFDLEDPNNFQDLVYEMTLRFDSADAKKARQASPMHKALGALDWHTLYTTNYDAHVEGALEDAGREAVVIASLKDFQQSRPRGACEVIKFHGTLKQPETIVLTESAYMRRLALEDPADQRLRSDLLSHSFLFIGYRFSDYNIRHIWYRIHQLRLRSGTRGGVGPVRRCFFATHGAGPVQPRILEQWGIDVIQLDPTDKEASVTELLQGIG